MPSIKRKAAQQVKIAKPVIKKSAKAVARSQVLERQVSRPVVSKVATGRREDGDDMIEISSDSDNSDDDLENDDDNGDRMDVDEDAEGQKKPTTNGVPAVNGTNGNPTANEDEEDDEDDNEPTFGELIREHAETIDVNTALGLLTKTTTTVDSAPSLASLGNLLNAALVTGDDANLEVCFNTTTDLSWVRNTIERLDPSLAGPLLRKLAARMHHRPGRAHTLMSWVQWTLISHGGALASQPGVTKSLQELHRVLEERARGLNSLLLLKGKLDMLESQMQLRRAQRTRALEPTITTAVNGPSRKRRRGSRVGLDDEDLEAACYDEAKDVDEDEEAGHILVNGVATSGELIADDEDAAVEDDDEDSEDNEEGEDDDDNEDEDPEETDEDNEDEIDFDDVDDDEDDDEDDAVVPPPKVQKKSATAFSKRR